MGSDPLLVDLSISWAASGMQLQINELSLLPLLLHVACNTYD